MNSTKDITAASDNVNQFSSSGLSLDKLMAASVTAFNSNLYEHATPKAFIKTLTSHANRSCTSYHPENFVQQAEPSLTGSTRRLVKSRYEPSPALFTCVRNLGA